MLPASFFESGDVQEREVVLGDDQKYKLHFKPVASRLWRKYYFADPKKDDDDFDRALDELVAASVCEKDGTPSLTLEQAQRLKLPVKLAMLKQIAAINEEPGKG